MAIFTVDLWTSSFHFHRPDPICTHLHLICTPTPLEGTPVKRLSKRLFDLSLAEASPFISLHCSLRHCYLGSHFVLGRIRPLRDEQPLPLAGGGELVAPDVSLHSAGESQVRRVRAADLPVEAQ